jgi:hypothetical protein
MDKDQVKAEAKTLFETKGALAAAAYLADTLFADVTDKAGAAYTGHLYRVAADIADYHIKPIGYLHDVIEDVAGWDADDLYDIGFDEYTVDGVIGVTRNWGEPYFDFIVRCGQTPQSIPVKRSDLKDNSNILRMPKLPDAEDIARLKKYLLSEYYLKDVQTGVIKAGTEFGVWMKSQPKEMHDWHIFAENSSEPNPATRKYIHHQGKIHRTWSLG